MASFPVPPSYTQSTVPETAATPQATAAPVALRGELWKYATGLLMTIVIYSAFFVVKGAKGFGGIGDSSRIVFFHVPVAILSFVCYVIATVYAVRVLNGHSDLESDGKSNAAMELGFVFCILTAITGSIFSRAVWGAYWNWDPTQTRIVVMLMLYASYLVLRSADSENPDRRARLSGVYTIITLVPAFFLIWIVPRVLSSFHPGTVLVRPKNNSLDYNIVLYTSFVAFGMLFAWLFQIRCRLHRLTTRRQLAQMHKMVGQ